MEEASGGDQPHRGVQNDGLELRDDDTVTIFWDDFVRLGMNASRETAAEVEARSSRGLPEDMATLIYTSGTTGEPKSGDHTQQLRRVHQKHIELLSAIKDDDLSMAFLPMSHILGKAWDFLLRHAGYHHSLQLRPPG